MSEIKDDAGFTASLTSDEQKTYFTNAIKTASEAAVTKFKNDDAEARKKAIPEKYELKFTETTPQEDRDAVVAYAKQHGMTIEAAQKLADHNQALAVAWNTRQQQLRKSEAEQWKKEVQTDKEIGGDKLADTLRVAKRAIDRFAPKDSPMMKFLDETGYGNHPLWVRLMFEIGKTMKEDSPPNGGDGSDGGPKPWGSRLYGGGPKN